MTHLGKTLFAVLLPPLLATFPAQAGPAYHLIDLGPDTMGNRIDGNGEVCGWQRGHPAVYSNGIWHVLQGSTKYEPNGLNSNGFVVGTRNEKGEIAVEWDPSGTFKHVVPGALSSFATAIHRDGTVYGAAIMPTGHAFPYTWNNGDLTQLPYAAGWSWTMPTAVNRSQQMSGWAANAGYEPACPMDPVICPSLHLVGRRHAGPIRHGGQGAAHGPPRRSPQDRFGHSDASLAGVDDRFRVFSRPWRGPRRAEPDERLVCDGANWNFRHPELTLTQAWRHVWERSLTQAGGLRQTRWRFRPRRGTDHS